MGIAIGCFDLDNTFPYFKNRDIEGAPAKVVNGNRFILLFIQTVGKRRRRRLMNRLIEYTVFSAFVTACRLATWPTRRSPLLVKATTDGVVRPPSWFAITTGSPLSITATTEFVVPRSIPMILLIR